MRQIATAAASSSAAEITSVACELAASENAARMSARRFASCRVSLGRAD
jgi:hypothetical protein